MSVVGTVEILIKGDARSLNRTLSEAERDLGAFGSRSESSMAQIGQRMSTRLTAPILAAGGLVAAQAIQWESAFAGVEKTVDASAATLAELNRELRTLATSGNSMVAGMANAHVTLAEIGELGGQLGVEAQNIGSFVDTVGQLTMATNLGADEAATWSAQLMNIMGMDIASSIGP